MEDELGICSCLRDYGSVGDVRVGDEQRLELRRRNLEALVLDDLLQPVHDEDFVVVVDQADVAGVQPAFLVDCVLRGFRIVQIPCNDLW